MEPFKTKVVYKHRNLVYNIDMIDYLNKNCTIDFNNNRFILFDNKHRSEQVISIHQAAYFDQHGFKFTDIARNELEEAQYEEAFHHYIGDDEAHSQTDLKADRPF